MAINTVLRNHPEPGATTRYPIERWQHPLFYLVLLLLLALGLWMRLHDLGLPMDRDGYDEGVYWQSLRSMAGGHPLYQQTFYSQPPFFLLSLYPIYMLFGQTLWSARLAVALVSMLGLIGAMCLGKGLGGRFGAISALLLLTVDPLYLAQSQTIQAEAPSVAFSILGIGAAYLWWQHPEGKTGIGLAALTGATLSLSILCKFLGVALLVPVGLLLLARVWSITRQPREKRFAGSISLLVGIAAFLITTAIVLLPFAGAFHAFWSSVVTFHSDAGVLFKDTQKGNFAIMQRLLISPITVLAFFGTIIALLRRNWLVFPLLAWFLVAFYLLWQQVPLFHHHLVTLIPPLIALAVAGIGSVDWIMIKNISSNKLVMITSILILLAVLVAGLNLLESRNYALTARTSTAKVVGAQTNIIQDLQTQTQPGQLVVTDAQFIAALANRDTPASLVDTSNVRINTRYLTVQEVTQEASQPQVQAILFYTDRLNNIPGFHSWVTQHFRLVRSYGPGKELWIKV